MIKYLGSKRTLIPVLSQLGQASGAKTALDLFTGTTRVAQALKKLGMNVTASDVASYAECFGKTWIELDGNSNWSRFPAKLVISPRSFASRPATSNPRMASAWMRFANELKATIAIRGCITHYSPA
jgi:hypothetical protein